MTATVLIDMHGPRGRAKADQAKEAGLLTVIGRPSKWGNPFKIGKDGTRAEVIAKYREYIQTQPQLLAALDELRGRVLGCWCAPYLCHGHVLMDLLGEPWRAKSMGVWITSFESTPLVPFGYPTTNSLTEIRQNVFPW